MTPRAARSDQFAARLDRAYLVETLSQLARIPTDVPLGYKTLMEPDDPKLVRYVQQEVRPRLAQLGYYDLLDVPRNNLVVRAGAGVSGRALLIQNYTPAQHHNLMPDPFSGRIASAREFGRDEPAVFGQGVSQNKAHQAVMLAVLKLLAEQAVDLSGRLYWALNNEGRSSHACSQAIIAALDPKPDFGIIQVGTGLKLSLGNRGRVDVVVRVTGRATHSSTPEDGLSAIAGANEVVNRLQELSWPDRHPLLGGRHAIPYKIEYSPLAPHTLPELATITIDRRLLPGDDPVAAAAEIQDAIGDLSPFHVSVAADVCMLPALVEPNHPVVHALRLSHAAETGQEPEIEYGRGSFDAGGPCALGIPTVMYGASGGVGLTGVDFVTIADVETEAHVLAQVIVRELA
jgi:acetylornithine deacetylase/succinyl-diaminopimelate desuccinylase-like protein